MRLIPTMGSSASSTTPRFTSRGSLFLQIGHWGKSPGFRLPSLSTFHGTTRYREPKPVPTSWDTFRSAVSLKSSSRDVCGYLTSLSLSMRKETGSHSFGHRSQGSRPVLQRHRELLHLSHSMPPLRRLWERLNCELCASAPSLARTFGERRSQTSRQEN